jgi:hypothetical protein
MHQPKAGPRRRPSRRLSPAAVAYLQSFKSPPVASWQTSPPWTTLAWPRS